MFLQPWGLCQCQAQSYRHVPCREGVFSVHNNLWGLLLCGPGKNVVHTCFYLNYRPCARLPGCLHGVHSEYSSANTGPRSLLGPFSRVGAGMGRVIHVCVFFPHQSRAFAHISPASRGPIHFYLLPKKNFSKLWFSSKKWFSNHMAKQMFETLLHVRELGWHPQP